MRFYKRCGDHSYLDTFIKEGICTSQMGRVLFVDDDNSIRMLARYILHEHDVATASDGVEALAHIETYGAPDVVITDVTMPNMNGLTLARKLEERNIPYAFITGQSYQKVQDDFGTLFPEERYLPKPFNFKKMQAFVNQYK